MSRLKFSREIAKCGLTIKSARINGTVVRAVAAGPYATESPYIEKKKNQERKVAKCVCMARIPIKTAAFATISSGDYFKTIYLCRGCFETFKEHCEDWF